MKEPKINNISSHAGLVPIYETTDELVERLCNTPSSILTNDKPAYNTKEYSRLYYSKNRDKLQALARERYHTGSHYKTGQLDSNSNTGRGFITEVVVAKALGLENGARCNCTVNFGFKYDLFDAGEYQKINVKSSKVKVDKRQSTNHWYFHLNNKYIPDTYILVAYSEDYKDIVHTWIIPADVDIVSGKISFAISNSYKGLSRVQEFEVDCEIYNQCLHDMSIDNCSVLTKV